VFGGTNVLAPSMALNNDPNTGIWSIGLLGGFYYVQQGLTQPQIVVWATPGDTQTNSFAYFASAATNPIPSFFSSGAGVITNYVYVTNYATLIVTNFAATNILYVSLSTLTNNWGGPTNVIDLLFGDQEYSTVTSCSVTGVVDKGSNVVNTATLSILNNAATNVTLTLAANIETRDGARQYTISNNADFIISFRYHPATIRTNAVTATQF